MDKSSVLLTDKLTVDATLGADSTVISIKPPKQLDGVSRTPTDVCCVIDISGSMGSEAKIKTDPGKSEGFGYSTLDLVKHALVTIIESLGADDRLSLVSFNASSEVVLSLTPMDKDGKKKAMKACQELDPDGSTNLWGGLFTGLEHLKSSKSRVNSAILLLTDGLPNIEPPRGHGPSLLKYKAEKGLPSHIHYFGFGYDMNSELLNELAGIGNGAYSFIPDGSFVGTIFINALANLLTTVASNVKVIIDLEGGTTIDPSLSPMLTYFNHKYESGKSLEIDIGTVGFGQERNVILPIGHNKSKTLNIELTYDSMFIEDKVSIKQEVVAQESDKLLIENQQFRLDVICELTKCIALGKQGKLKDATKNVEALMKKKQDALGPKEQKYIQDVIYDLKEQVLLALSKDEFFNKWGSHYFYSLQRAHILQQRNNFKDPGVQHYGGEIFQSLQDKIEELFITIPPPKPSLKNQQALFNSSGTKGSSKPQAAPKSMRVFHNAQSGCFSGDSQVLMADGSTKLVKNIQKGDLISSPENSCSRIMCVVKTHIKSGRAIMCKLPGGIKITPWHPVRIEGKWFFPEQLVEGEEVDCDDFFDFVLDQGHIAMINGVECVTLGHGFKGEIVEHAFLGSMAVLKELERMRGFGEGVVELAQDCFRRDPETTLIVGLNGIDE